MGKFYDVIPESVFPFIKKQKIFFVASAPLHGGTVNTSPKCAEGCMQLVSNKRFRYTDLTGSGNETISHVLEPGNGRITIMFIAFEGSPQIVRLFGKATVYERFEAHHPGEPSPPYSLFYPPTIGQQSAPIGTRAVIDVAVFQCSTSCGYSVPFFDYVQPRTVLHSYFDRREKNETGERKRIRALLRTDSEADDSGSLHVIGADGLRRVPKTDHEAYVAMTNALSLDGLDGLRTVRSAIQPAEKEKLTSKRRAYDAFFPPKPEEAVELGPFRPEAPCFYQTAKSAKRRKSSPLFGPSAMPMVTFLLGIVFAMLAQGLLSAWRVSPKFGNLSSTTQ